MKQGILEESAVQKYPIGLRYALGDMVFRYCKAAENLDAACGAFNDGDKIHPSGGGIVAHAAGATRVKLDCADVVLENELAGGYLARYYTPFISRIKSNLATVAGIIDILLLDPLALPIAAAEWVCAYPSIYSRILNRGGTAIDDNWMSVVCVPLIDITSGNYFWGLTWGPFPSQVGSWANLVGRTTNKRKVGFDYNGALVYRTGAEAGDAHFQEAGYLLFNGNTAATPYGDQLVMLQLAP